MAGLLDEFSAFASTPQGQGLLSAAFGGLAGARRGQPINSLGRAGLAGMAGYTGAQDRITQEAESATQRKFREMQMQGLEAQMAKQVAQDKWKAGLSDVLAPKPQEIDQFTGTTQMQGPSQEVVQKYLMDPNSPFADKLLEQKLFPKAADYLTVDGTVLQKGPNGLTPVYTAPAKPEGKPTKVQEYEYAKANGYKGTLEQYVSIGPSIMAGAVAPLRQAQIDNINAENAYNLPPPVAPRPAAGGGATVSAGGKTYTFPNAAAAAAFKKQAGIQ